MESVTSHALKTFFQRLGKQIPTPATLYLFGGSALCLLGSPRETLDVDYSIENAPPEVEQILNGWRRIEIGFGTDQLCGIHLFASKGRSAPSA